MKIKEASKKGMESFIIVNPIYDTVFKRLMENQRIVKFFLSTILGQQIEDVSVLPQEFTYKMEETSVEKGKRKKKEKKGNIEYFSIFRLDFMASVRTADGKHKKILIEVQKSWDTMDVVRFRKYLGKQYTRKEIIDGKETVLPITTIYILGNNLPEIECPCVKTGRVSTDMRDRKPVNAKAEFIELLTHDSYVIQAGRITDVRYTTNLDRLLSIFEQNYFVVQGSDVIKEYHCQPGDENMELITGVLREMAANSEERKKIEDEKEALRVFNNALNEKNKTIEEKDKTIEEKDKTIGEKDKTIDEQQKSLEEKDKSIKDQAREIAKLKRLLRNKQAE
ncbi:MAG: hypothetical protein LBK58_14195 [Prevotellaceae bacterium]|jgi:hypothetical protein|nr:hypothetical protein [Prevotellaceae bacterium]